MRHPSLSRPIFFIRKADPTVDRIVREDGRVRMIIVFVPEPSAAVPVAVELVENEDAQLIEFDGGLGTVWAAKVIEEVDGRVPVGSVMFGAESLEGAAAYGARYEAQGSWTRGGAGTLPQPYD